MSGRSSRGGGAVAPDALRPHREEARGRDRTAARRAPAAPFGDEVASPGSPGADLVGAAGLLLAGLALESARHEPGTALSPAVRAALEERFGTDLADVRVHEGPAAQRVTTLAGARGVAVGADVLLDRADAGDAAVLAHEVAHVAQWKRATRVADGWSSPGDPAERAARSAAHGDAGAGQAGPAVAAAASRQEKPTLSKAEQDRQVGAVIGDLAMMRLRDPNGFMHYAAEHEALLYALLGPHGYQGCWEFLPKYLDDFDAAFARWDAPSGDIRDLGILGSRLDHLPNRFALQHERWEQQQNQLVMGALPDGTGYMGTQRDYEAAVRAQHIDRKLRTLQNITGGIGGAIGYGLGGDEGSDVGAVGDQLLTVAGGVAGARNQMRNVSATPTTPRRDNGAEIRRAGPPPTTTPKAPAPPAAPKPAPAPQPAQPPAPVYSEFPPMTVPAATPAKAPAAPTVPATTAPAKPAATPKAPAPTKSAPAAPKPAKTPATTAPAPATGASGGGPAGRNQARTTKPQTSGEGFIENIQVSKTLEGETSTTIRGRLDAPSTTGRSGFEESIRGIPGMQRAHLWTWRFGEEARPGIMNAPTRVNLSDQKVLENTIVNFSADVRAKGFTPYLQVTGVSKPGQPEVFDHAEYTFWAQGPNGEVAGFTTTVSAEGVISDFMPVSRAPRVPGGAR